MNSTCRLRVLTVDLRNASGRARYAIAVLPARERDPKHALPKLHRRRAAQR